MGNVLDIQFTFGNATRRSRHHALVVQASSCSGAQPLLGPVALWPQDLGWHTSSWSCSACQDRSGGICGAREEGAAKISSHPSQAGSSAGGRRTQPGETVLWGWSQPSLLQGSLWGTEGLMCISHLACSCPGQAVLCILHPWFRQQEGDTPLQNKVRGDGEQLSPKLGSKPCGCPPLCKALWLLPLLASRIVFFWCQFIVTHVYTLTSS